MLLWILLLGILELSVASVSVKGRPQNLQDSYQEHRYPQYPGRIQQQSTVKQVHIIFRHGDRAPVGTYPNDPNKNYDWPFGRAQLTDVGKRQHYDLGNYLRRRYSDLLTTDPREIKVRSSDVDRCIASAMSNLAAFFRPAGKWIWNHNLPWQPVPIHTAPGETDWLLNEDAKCPAADVIKKNVMNSPEGIRYAQKYQRLFQYVTDHSGKTVNDPSSVLSVYGITLINKLKNLTIPSWVDPIWDEFTNAADDAFVVTYSSKPFLKMRGGPLIGHILDLMKKYDSEDHSVVQPKAYIYSTHDANVAAFLNALGVFNGRQIPYAGTVLVELHNRPQRSGYTVSMFYRNSSDHEPFPLALPGCEEDCPLSYFEDLVQDMIPRDIKADCYGQQQQPQQQEPVNQRLEEQSSTSQQQCCCCSQCGSAPLAPLELSPGRAYQGGEYRSKMQEILLEMRGLLDQHRRSVDQSIQDLFREMDESDQALTRAREEHRRTSERVTQHNRNHIKG